MQTLLKYVFRRQLLVVVLHLVSWAIFIFYPFIFFKITVIGYGFWAKQIVNAVFLAGAFYFCTYYLFPRLIKRRKLIRHILILLAIVVFIPVQQYVLEFYIFSRYEDHVQVISPISKARIAEFHSFTPKKNIKVIIRHDETNSGNFLRMPFPAHRIFFPETFQTSLSSVLFVLLVSGFVSVAGELFRTEKQRKELENQRLNAELSFLKSQVNPHFFFNTLNTIYLLAHKKSDQTEQVVVKLSEIMRYMIYESNAPEVSLERELKYLGDYVDLQRLRLSKKVDVKFVVEGDPTGLLIAPMMLIPFVENTFKHGVSYVEDCSIYIELKITGDAIRFMTRNNIFERKEDVEGSAGLGLENARKRLSLVYPGCHQLEISRKDKEFIINLFIQLKNDPVYSC